MPRVVIVGDIKEAEMLPLLTFLNKLPTKKVCYSCMLTQRQRR